jgi:hypothetical protein
MAKRVEQRSYSVRHIALFVDAQQMHMHTREHYITRPPPFVCIITNMRFDDWHVLLLPSETIIHCALFLRFRPPSARVRKGSFSMGSLAAATT